MHGHDGHGHGALPAAGSANAQNRKRLAWALALTLTYMAAEVVGGLVTGSLALLADAAHMLTDAGGLALALIAIHYAQRPATPKATYGYLRLEILAALTNAVVLLVLSVFVLLEAYRRFVDPPQILGTPMLIVASIGLVVNLISMRILAGGKSASLNMRGAYFEVLSDMLGSVGVIVAALVVLWTGWPYADPIIGAGIGLFIVPRTWRLLREAVHILLEGTPPHVDVDAMARALEAIDGVQSVHDLHVWTITSGLDAMSAHLIVDDVASTQPVLRAAQALLKDQFEIEHTTLQIEDEQTRAGEARLHV